jgi:DNA repair exonuclease SbcCD ATPase subunit
MKLIGLEIHNFLSIGHAELDMDDKGLVLMTGENLDDPSAISNGAGKSSVPDAIYWCNYGETARGQSGDSVINSVAKKNCKVVNHWLDGDLCYVITRTRKFDGKSQTTVMSQKDVKDPVVDMTKGTEKETQLVINEIMGCSKEVFSASIYAGQDSMPDLPKMTDKELKTLIEEATGTERFSKGHVEALRLLKHADVLWKTAIAESHRLESKLHAVKDEVRGVAIEFKTFKEGADDKKVELLASRLEFQTKCKVLLKSTKPTGISPVTERIAKLQDELDGIKERVALVDKMKLDAAPLLEDKKRQGYKVVAIKEIIDNLSLAKDNAEEEMKKPCRSCGKPHDDSEIEKWKEHQGELIKEKTAEWVLATKKYKDFRKTHAIAEEAVLKEQAKVPSSEKLHEELKGLAAEKNKLDNAKKEVEMVVGILKKLDADIAAVHLNPYKSLLTRGKHKLAEVRDDFSAAGLAVEEAEEVFETHQHVVDVFSPSGVRAHILDSVTPYLNDKTAEYLSALSDSSIEATWSTLAETTKGELREKFNIEVSNVLGAKNYGSLSGGEKRKVRLATMLALQDLIATRAAKPISLFIGDEIDDALDGAGLERLMGIFERKSKEKGTVLIISHNDLTDWIDEVATVTKSGNVATISGVLNV